MNFIGKKAKINVDRYIKRELSEKFKDFINNNKNTIFTLEQEERYINTRIYTLKEDGTWLFHLSDLKLL